jgi:hypothetical protein
VSKEASMTNRGEGAREPRWRVEAGLVAAAFVFSVFLWAVIYLINKVA